jgi:tetratricopeptide (TPR) repeat protein
LKSNPIVLNFAVALMLLTLTSAAFARDGGPKGTLGLLGTAPVELLPTDIAGVDGRYVNNPTDPEDFYDRGRVLLTMNELDAAEADFLGVYDWKKDDAEFNILMTKLYLKKGLVTDYLEYSRKAVDLAPENPEAHLVRATALRLIGEFDQALEEADVAIKLEPKLKQAHFILAIIELSRSDLEKAEQELALASKEIVDKNPAELTLEEKNLEYGIREVRGKMAMIKSAVVEMLDIGAQAMENNDFTRAMGLFEDAKQIWPANPRVYAEMAFKYYIVDKDYRKAIALYEKALSLDSGSRQALMGLYTVYSTVGEKKKAKSYLERIRRSEKK